MTDHESDGEEKRMAEPVLVRARAPEDTDDFLNLLLMSAPGFFHALYGDSFERVYRELFRHPMNTFNYKLVDIVKLNGDTAGMVLRYDWMTGRDKRNRSNTGLVMFKQMGREKTLSNFENMLWLDIVLLNMDEGTFYVSNMAVYPQFRRRGLATMILSHCEELARKAGNTKIALDVEPSHEPAMQLYRKLGMKMVGEPKRTTIDGEDFEFLRMEKDV